VYFSAAGSSLGWSYAAGLAVAHGAATADYVGYYISTGTRLPLMHVYATDITLRLGVSHPRAVLPNCSLF
jgi:hypothetical protein